MQGLIGAISRLGVMGLIMAAVLGASIYAGLATTAAIVLGLGLAGSVGLISMARRPRRTAAQEIAAMMSPTAVIPSMRLAQTTGVDAMAPQDAPVDPEASMPRWRRPSLLEARRSDPYNSAPAFRLPMRFMDDNASEADLRVVRYAVVPVLDKPDEVLGLRLSDLAAGDEVQVVGTSGAFIEIFCPNGDQGWVHRTTLGQRTPEALPALNPNGSRSHEADDALTALLTARGLI